MKAKNLVRLRRTSQTFFLLFFLFLLCRTTLSQDLYLNYSPVFSSEQTLALDQPVTFFFQMDPLILISSLLSGHRLVEGSLWALGVLLLTLCLGRVFCGFICPLGTLHHMTGWFRPALDSEALVKANSKPAGRRIKYFLLILLLSAALLGLNLTGLLDPISFLFRSVALAILPGIGTGIRELVEILAASDARALNHMGRGIEYLVAPLFGYEYKAFQTAWFMGALFLIILFLNRIRPRFWCRTLCPLGALLGVCSRFTMFRLEKDSRKCTHCRLCTGVCQGAASPEPGSPWQDSECLMCLNCYDSCPEDALHFRFGLPSRANPGPDMGRRAVLGGLLAGISIPFLGTLDGQVHKVADARVIRPPGSLPEKEFLTLCQRCGLCMKVCPTNAINPALSEAGMSGFWTPVLIMTLGYCQYNCTLCGSVCPTGAIRPISIKEKIGIPVRIGSAYVDRGRCLPWSGNGPCIVCEEHCPTSPKAVYLHEASLPGPDGTSLKVKLPHVDLKRCVGCGICENKCPVRGKPAIRVISAGESRSFQNQILLDPYATQ